MGAQLNLRTAFESRGTLGGRSRGWRCLIIHPADEWAEQSTKRVSFDLFIEGGSCPGSQPWPEREGKKAETRFNFFSPERVPVFTPL